MVRSSLKRPLPLRSLDLVHLTLVGHLSVLLVVSHFFITVAMGGQETETTAVEGGARVVRASAAGGEDRSAEIIDQNVVTVTAATARTPVPSPPTGSSSSSFSASSPSSSTSVSQSDEAVRKLTSLLLKGQTLLLEAAEKQQIQRQSRAEESEEIGSDASIVDDVSPEASPVVTTPQTNTRLTFNTLAFDEATASVNAVLSGFLSDLVALDMPVSAQMSIHRGEEEDDDDYDGLSRASVHRGEEDAAGTERTGTTRKDSTSTGPEGNKGDGIHDDDDVGSGDISNYDESGANYNDDENGNDNTDRASTTTTNTTTNTGPRELGSCLPSLYAAPVRKPPKLLGGALAIIFNGGECRVVRGLLPGTRKVECDSPSIEYALVPPGFEWGHKSAEMWAGRSCDGEMTRCGAGTTTSFSNRVDVPIAEGDSTDDKPGGFEWCRAASKDSLIDSAFEENAALFKELN